jgi:hypothetical protein
LLNAKAVGGPRRVGWPTYIIEFHTTFQPAVEFRRVDRQPASETAAAGKFVGAHTIRERLSPQ